MYRRSCPPGSDPLKRDRSGLYRLQEFWFYRRDFGPITEEAVRHLQGQEGIEEMESWGLRPGLQFSASWNAKEQGEVHEPQYKAREWLISGPNRPGGSITPLYITVHQTDNIDAGC